MIATQTRLKFNLKPEILFNYLGQFDNHLQIDTFQLSDLSCGSNVSPDFEREHVFDINGFISNGKLMFTFTFDQNEYQEKTVQKISESYLKYLVILIDHCTQAREREVTPSDLGYSKLSIAELDELNRELEELL